MNDTLVTVILPHYDAAPYLGQALQSIAGQSLRRFELHLVDDSSPNDAWMEVMRPFRGDPRMHVWRTSRNVGPYRITNCIIRRTRAPFIAFQDADDRSAPGRLETLTRAAGRWEADIVGSAVRTIDDTGAGRSVRRFPRYANLLLRLGRRFVALHPATLVRRSAAEGMGLFDGTRRYAADMEFIHRAFHRGLRIRNVGDVLYEHRVHPRSLTQSAETGHDAPERLAYVDAVFARTRSEVQDPVDSDVEFDLLAV